MGKNKQINKKVLDTTSIVMIAVFCVLIIGVTVIVLITATGKDDEISVRDNVGEENVDGENAAKETEDLLTYEDIKDAIPNAQPGSTYTYIDDNGNMQTITVPYETEGEIQEVDLSSKYKFEDYTDLSDKFLEVCRAGDVDELRKLYYGDFLDEMRTNMEIVPSLEEFEAGLKSNMLSVTGFEEYEYGSVEMPPSGSAGAYANFIYSQVNNGKTIPLRESDIQDCVGLVVYINNTYKTNHFLAKINGYWYFIV